MAGPRVGGKLFGTDGVRGIVNQDLTPNLALELGQAIGTYFGSGSRVIVGRDVRKGGLMLLRSLVAGLASAGVKVYYAGLLPTPALQYEIKSTGGFDGGVMITASHNPPAYNGIKVIGGDGIEVPREVERTIEELYFEQRFKLVSRGELSERVVRVHGVLERYVNGVVSVVDGELIAKRGYKVVIDAGNSVGALATPAVVKRLGGKPVTLNANLDPDFPGREPEPTTTTLADAARTVQAVGADLGVGHDGDADRSIFIDELGRVHWGDRSAALLAGHLLGKHPELPRRVYTGVSSSMLVEEYLKEMGITVVWMKVGSVDISRRLKEEGGLCGFEENGGFMYPPHQDVRDGAMTVALFLELMAKERERASQLFGKLPVYYSIKTKIPMTREVALKVVEELKRVYSDRRMITIDGIKVVEEDAWFLVRPSGTEPVLRVMVEARTRERAETILRELRTLIRGAAG